MEDTGRHRQRMLERAGVVRTSDGGIIPNLSPLGSRSHGLHLRHLPQALHSSEIFALHLAGVRVATAAAVKRIESKAVSE